MTTKSQGHYVKSTNLQIKSKRRYPTHGTDQTVVSVAVAVPAEVGSCILNVRGSRKSQIGVVPFMLVGLRPLPAPRRRSEWRATAQQPLSRDPM